MFRRILVPLDGSKIAECALPYARALAEQLAAEVELLEVLNFGEVAESVSAGTAEILNKNMMHAGRIAKSFQNITTRSRIERGAAASIIIDAAAADRETLIVMASHGRSGIRRWLLGSVAE